MTSRKAYFALIGVALYLFVSGWFVANLDTRPELKAVAEQPGFAPVQQVISALFVIGLALPSFWTFVAWQGRRRGLTVLVVLGAFALLIETVALHTGVPYGQFAYGDKIGPKLPGGVPWTVPFAWSPLLLAATFLTRRRATRLPAVAIGGALWLVVFDLVLDPGAVVQGFWHYPTGGLFYGVPLSNFAGWFFSGVIGMAFLWRVADLPAQPGAFPRGLLTSTWLILVFWTSVTLWRSLWAPALIGFGLWVFIGRLLFADFYARTEREGLVARPEN